MCSPRKLKFCHHPATRFSIGEIDFLWCPFETKLKAVEKKNGTSSWGPFQRGWRPKYVSRVRCSVLGLKHCLRTRSSLQHMRYPTSWPLQGKIFPYKLQNLSVWDPQSQIFCGSTLSGGSCSNTFQTWTSSLCIWHATWELFCKNEFCVSTKVEALVIASKHCSSVLSCWNLLPNKTKLLNSPRTKILICQVLPSGEKGI